MSTQEITIPTTVTTIDTVFATSALTYLVTLYVINTIINNMLKRKANPFKNTFLLTISSAFAKKQINFCFSLLKISESNPFFL